MSNVVKNIVIRAVKNRMTTGEKFEDIIRSYPKLTKAEIEEIKEAFKGGV